MSNAEKGRIPHKNPEGSMAQAIVIVWEHYQEVVLDLVYSLWMWHLPGTQWEYKVINKVHGVLLINEKPCNRQDRSKIRTTP
jgi:hypothetical protein